MPLIPIIIGIDDILSPKDTIDELYSKGI